MKRILAVILSFVMIMFSSGILTGCKSNEQIKSKAVLDNWSQYRYKDTVTLKVAMCQANNYWDMTDNALIDLIYNALNIKIETEWCLTWSEYDEKVKLASATNSLPDAFVCHSYDLFAKMAEAGQLKDLTNCYNSDDGKWLSDIYKSYGTNSPLLSSTFNNMIYSIPSTTFSGQHAMLWIRKDWLDALNLDVPSTLEDVFNVARAFVNNDPDGNGKKDTIGLPYNRWMLGINNSSRHIDPIYNALGAFPNKWLLDKNGDVYYGTVAPEMKKALSTVLSAVQEGIIDPNCEGQDEISSGICGIYFGPWWSPGGELSTIHETEPDAEWICTSAPLNSDGQYVTARFSSSDWGTGGVVVNKDCPNPESVFRVMKLCRALFDGDAEVFKAFGQDELPQGFSEPFNVQIQNDNGLYQINEKLLEIGETADPSALNTTDRKKYDMYQQYINDPLSMKSEDWATIYSQLVGIPETKNSKLVYKDSAIYDLPAEINEAFGDFYVYSLNAIHDILTGVKTLDAFDQLVVDYKAMGGTEVESMIEEYLSKSS